MLISLNEIKKLVDIKVSDDELLSLIGSRLVEVESVDDWAKKFKRIYVAKVLSCEDIPETHLHLLKIDAGETLNQEIDPAHDGFIQVVCGAPNVRAGMLAAWLAPGAIVPATFGAPEPFTISARKLRGFESFGMLAAADELSLGSDHEGIIELDPATAVPGTPLSSVLDLDDKILEVENKSLTHRPDCFGLIGFAREVAGILGKKFSEPAFLTSNLLPEKSPEAVTVKISDPNLCPRYSCAVFDFKKLNNFRSAYFTNDDLFLVKAGMRPISPIVDLTNRLMLLTGQPLHAFDYDKFITVGGSKTPEISVRLAREGETLTLLDDRTVTLNRTDILITSADAPVALAGAMGGKSTEIDASTSRILLESATFSLYNLRKTQMSHGIFSEAITRFTKGQPAELTLPVLTEAIRLLGESPQLVVDTYPTPRDNPEIPVSLSEINSLLSSTYTEELVETTLTNVSFSVKKSENRSADETSEKSASSFLITAPFWRTDISIKEDIIEEVGRLLGYDNLPLNYPTRPFISATTEPLLELKSRLRSTLSDRLGANELLTYSFVSKSLQEKVGESLDDSYKIVNSISPELECFRQSLVPSLLDKIRENEKAGFSDFTLYELNQVAKKSFGLTEENVPRLETHLGLTTFGDFYKAKYLLHELERSLRLKLTLKPLESSSLFEPLRSVEIWLDSEFLGVLGEIKLSVLSRFKLSAPLSALELNLEPLTLQHPSQKLNLTLSKFPSTSRDLTFRVPLETPFETIESAILETLKPLEKTEQLLFSLTPLSIYKKPLGKTKNLSFRLKLSSLEKTFTSAEVSAIIEQIINNLSTLGAEVV